MQYVKGALDGDHMCYDTDITMGLLGHIPYWLRRKSDSFFTFHSLLQFISAGTFAVVQMVICRGRQDHFTQLYEY